MLLGRSLTDDQPVVIGGACVADIAETHAISVIRLPFAAVRRRSPPPATYAKP